MGILQRCDPTGPAPKRRSGTTIDAVPPGETVAVRLRLSPQRTGRRHVRRGYDAVLEIDVTRPTSSTHSVLPDRLSEEERFIARRAFAGLLWGKQLYRYNVRQWLEGDPAEPTPPPERMDRSATRPGGTSPSPTSSPCRTSGSTRGSPPGIWRSTASRLPMSIPSSPRSNWSCSCREWAMHPDGQLAAYEWAFGDVNPPVHAWAAWQVYVIDGSRDRDFLDPRVHQAADEFQLVGQPQGCRRVQPVRGRLPRHGQHRPVRPLGAAAPGYRLEQSDATSWMAFFCLALLRISAELARSGPGLGRHRHQVPGALPVHRPGRATFRLAERQLVGRRGRLLLRRARTTRRQLRNRCGCARWSACCRCSRWPHRPSAYPTSCPTSPPGWRGCTSAGRSCSVGCCADPAQTIGVCCCRSSTRAACGGCLSRMFDEGEFLSPFGIRSLSAAYRDGYTTAVDGASMTIDYEPGESHSGLFGGNSNWRGPIWMPVNVLLADALRTYGHYLGDEVGSKCRPARAPR